MPIESCAVPFIEASKLTALAATLLASSGCRILDIDLQADEPILRVRFCDSSEPGRPFQFPGCRIIWENVI